MVVRGRSRVAGLMEAEGRRRVVWMMEAAGSGSRLVAWRERNRLREKIGDQIDVPPPKFWAPIKILGYYFFNELYPYLARFYTVPEFGTHLNRASLC